MSLVKFIFEQFEDDIELKDLHKIDRDRIIYNQLKKKAERKFKRIASGTARVVYEFKDDMAIKDGKNDKGIAQNEVEYNLGTDRFAEDMVTKVYYGAENLSFIIAEKAEKLRVADFKRITGIEWKQFIEVVDHLENVNNPRTSYRDPSEEVEELFSNEFVNEFEQFVGNFGLTEVMGDFKRISSYGVVNRDYGDDVVLTDYGLTKEVYKKHYI